MAQNGSLVEVVKIDPIDLDLLRVIEADGRISIKALAEHIGLTAAPTQNRLRRLEKLGVIRGYRAQVNPQILGREAVGFLEIQLDCANASDRSVFEVALASVEGLVEAHRMSGHWDYLIKVRVDGASKLISILTHEVPKLPHVSETRISLAVKTIYPKG